MFVMLSARTLFRRCCSHPVDTTRVRSRPRGATGIPRQSFYSSSRPDVTLLSTPFGTDGSRDATRRESETRMRRRRRRGTTSSSGFTRNEKSDFSYMPRANPQTVFQRANRFQHAISTRISLDSNFMKKASRDSWSEKRKSSVIFL